MEVPHTPLSGALVGSLNSHPCLTSEYQPRLSGDSRLPSHMAVIRPCPPSLPLAGYLRSLAKTEGLKKIQTLIVPQLLFLKKISLLSKTKEDLKLVKKNHQ